VAVDPKSKAHGVLPKHSREDSVIRNPDASGWFAFIDLAEDVNADGAKAFLQRLQNEAEALRAQRDPHTNQRRATVAIAVSPTFFRSSAGTARIDPPGGIPAGLQAPFVVPNASPAGGDVFLYLMATAEEVAAQFLARFDALRPSPVAALRVERGFQRTDGREWFGYRDGVRNVAPQDRDGFVWTDPDAFPEEPAWTAGGTYVAYMKVRQNPQAAAGIGTDGLDQAFGRRSDGTRLDGQAGDPNPSTEPDDTSALPPTSHVRKAGPRGASRDAVRIFRRGLPFQEMTPDGLHMGLQFASFQPTADYFKVILSRWMLNADFPTQSVGQDSLVARGLVTFEKAGLYFVLPQGENFVGEALFASAEAKTTPANGRIAIRKKVVDTSGNELARSLEDFTISVTDSTGNPVATVTTNAAGHAQTDALPTGATYTVEEVNIPGGVTAPPAQAITLDQAHVVVTLVNQAQPGYGG
jgi:Dyp-type peroxidase family